MDQVHKQHEVSFFQICRGKKLALPRVFGELTEHAPLSQLYSVYNAGESLNTSYLTPYLEPMDPDFRNGVNFAFSGAATQPRYKPFSLDVQILQFLRFRARSPELFSKGTLLKNNKLQLYVPSKKNMNAK